MKKKFIAYGLILVSCLCLLVVGIVTVLATTQRQVDAGLFVRFTAEDIDGSVTMYYRIGGSGDWVKNGDTIVFNVEDNDNQAQTTDLTLDSEVTKSSKYVEFKYEFVNTGSKYYTATMMLETTERENISLTYKYNDPTETKEYDDFKYAVVVPGETDASNAKTYFIKVGMEDLSRSANFSGTFNWILKGYNLVNNEELVLTNLDYVETNVAGTYSAKYNGSPLEDNTLVIPSQIGDSPVTTVGKCEGTLPENTKVVVSEGITSIGSNAFNGQTGLTEIELPASLVTIDTTAFYACSNLTTVTFPEDSQLKEIKTSAFNSSGLSDVDLPDSLENIGNFGFYYSQIESITIPASVTTIGNAALACHTLKEINLESDEYFVMVNQCLIEKSTGRLLRGLEGCTAIPTIETGSPVVIKSIDNLAIANNYSLTSLDIPEGLTKIGTSGIYNAFNVTSITLPSTLTEIGTSNFNATKVETIIIPANLKKIGASSFTNNSNLTTIIVDEGNQYYSGLGNCLIEIQTNTVIAGCKNSIIPDNVLIIGNEAFRGITLTTLTIPSNVTTINQLAFYYCTSLESITIPSNVTFIGGSAFYSLSINTIHLEKISGWQISTSLTENYENISTEYDLSDDSVTTNLFKNTYRNYNWKNVN